MNFALEHAEFGQKFPLAFGPMGAGYNRIVAAKQPHDLLCKKGPVTSMRSNPIAFGPMGAEYNRIVAAKQPMTYYVKRTSD